MNNFSNDLALSQFGCIAYQAGHSNSTLANAFGLQGYQLRFVIEGNAVPLPATLWLFGSGLLGLVGVARGKKAV
jgi:hypothetical protein